MPPPPESEFRRLVSAGHGRAGRLLARGECPVYREVLLDACLHARVYDRQCEPSRAPYVYRLLQVAGGEVEDSILPAVWESLRRVDPDNDPMNTRGHMLKVAEAAACAGNTEAHAVLREVFLERAKVRGYAGASELIRVDRADGYEMVLSQLGEHGLDDDDPDLGWWLPALHNEAREVMGDEEAQAILNRSLKAMPVLKKLYAEMNRQNAEWRKTSRPRRQSLDEAIAAVTGETLSPEWHFSRIFSEAGLWGRRASVRQLLQAARRLETESDPQRQYWLLSVFWTRPIPTGPKPLLPFLRSPVACLKRGACVAMCELDESPLIREAALELMDDQEWKDWGIRLLARQFIPDDLPRVLDLILRQQDIHDIHSTMQSALAILDNNEFDDADSLMLTIYNGTPCSTCRNRAVEHLSEGDWLTEELREECRWDSYPGTRELAEQSSG